MVSNAGFTGLIVLSVFIPILILIALVALMAGVFQMRRSMQNTSEKLSEIYELLLLKQKSE